MIDELRVVNLGVIQEAVLEPGPGLVVVTGETGAGKTMLLGALRLLLGSTARSDAIGPHGDEARVEGRFVTEEGEEIIATRRITPSGRSRAYVDGSMVPAKELSATLGPLVEIVGQHDHLFITKPASIRALLDSVLDPEGQEALRVYDGAWAAWSEVVAAQAEVGGDRPALERERELAAHQANEIEAAGFTDDAEEPLSQKAARLRHAEELTEELAGTVTALDRAESFDEAVGRLRRASGLDSSLEPLLADAEAVQAHIAELRAGLRRSLDGLDAASGELEEVEARIALLGDLKRKYGGTLAEVLEFGREAALRADSLSGLLERADQLDEEKSAAAAALDAAGERLRAARLRSAKEVAGIAAGHLRQLGFSNPVVELSVTAATPSAGGADAVELLFSSDAAITPGPASRVASGGELSRLVLSMRLASGVGDAAVVAFDEIDAGIGGATALAMGEKLKGLAPGRQVLCVTHLPQVAAFATTHLVVDRVGASATVRPVVGDDRLAEIARMLSGLPESERGQEHAAELLALGASARG